MVSDASIHTRLKLERVQRRQCFGFLFRRLRRRTISVSVHRTLLACHRRLLSILIISDCRIRFQYLQNIIIIINSHSRASSILVHLIVNNLDDSWRIISWDRCSRNNRICMEEKHHFIHTISNQIMKCFHPQFSYNRRTTKFQLKICCPGRYHHGLSLDFSSEIWCFL